MPLEPIHHWIDTPDALDAVCTQLADAACVAVDTEFFRETSFHPVPALIQLSRGDVAYLIDPVAVAATPAARELLGESGPVKLMHASSEDLEVLHHWAGVAVQPLVDTQVAQSLLSEDPAMGYQRLVEQWTGDALPKDETRSDWLARPLSDAQRRYAALDVIYLPRVWAAQREVLIAHERLAWLADDCQALVAQSGRSATSDGEWYRRHRQLWRLSPRAIAAYQRLTAWREAEARRRDLPRNWLASDKVLFAVAEAMPANRYELAAVEGVKPSLVKREGESLLALVKEAARLEASALPAALPSPLGGPFKRRFKALKRVVAQTAETLGIAPEVLARRRDLEALVAADLAGEPLPLPGGWRGALLGADLAQALKTIDTPVEE